MNDITVRQFFDNPTISHASVLTAMDAKDGFCGRSFNINAMPWANMKYCLRLLQKDGIDVVESLFEICYDVAGDEFWNASAFEFFGAKAYIFEQFKKTVENEAKQLSGRGQDDHLWHMAGADRLKPFNDLLPLMALGKQFGMYPPDIGRKPYGEVLNMLVALKIQGEVESDFVKLKK